MHSLRQTTVFPYALCFPTIDIGDQRFIHSKISGSGTDPCVKHARTLPPTLAARGWVTNHSHHPIAPQTPHCNNLSDQPLPWMTLGIPHSKSNISLTKFLMSILCKPSKLLQRMLLRVNFNKASPLTGSSFKPLALHTLHLHWMPADGSADPQPPIPRGNHRALRCKPQRRDLGGWQQRCHYNGTIMHCVHLIYSGILSISMYIYICGPGFMNKPAMQV